jgi:hypothetical protein
MNIEAKIETNSSVRTVTGEITSLRPELIRFVQALARTAAVQDYEYFCRTGAVLSYDGGNQE